MTDGPGWVRFSAPLQPLAWGRNVYTVLLVPAELATAAAAARTRRVEGRVDDEPVNVGLNRADIIAETFVYVGKPLQRRLGARPGDVVVCRLRPADPDEVPVPADVAGALATSGRQGAFDGLPPTRRRRLLQPVEAAATASTRAARVRALVSSVGPAGPQQPRRSVPPRA